MGPLIKNNYLIIEEYKIKYFHYQTGNKRENSKQRASVAIGTESQIAFVLRNNKYVPICGHYFWNGNAGANLFCQELGGTGGSIIGGTYGAGKVPLPEDGLQVGKCESGDSWLQCTGGCNSLDIGGQCQYGGNCKAGANAGVKIRCNGKITTFRA